MSGTSRCVSESPAVALLLCLGPHPALGAGKPSGGGFLGDSLREAQSWAEGWVSAPLQVPARPARATAQGRNHG